MYNIALYSRKAVACDECLEAGLDRHLRIFLVSFQNFLFGLVEPTANRRAHLGL